MTPEFTPLHHGWRVESGTLRHGSRRRKDGTKPGLTKRQRTLMHDTTSSRAVYVAVTECGRAAKIGSSWNPVVRVAEGVKIEARKIGVGRPVLIRVFFAPSRRSALRLERLCHRILDPDRIHPIKREWFAMGPRFRVLLSRLDRKFRHRTADSALGGQP